MGNSNRSPSVTSLNDKTTRCRFLFGNPDPNSRPSDLTSTAAQFTCRLIISIPSGRSIVHLHLRRHSARYVANWGCQRQSLHCPIHLAIEGSPSPRAHKVMLKSLNPSTMLLSAADTRSKPYQALVEESEHDCFVLLDEWEENQTKNKMKQNGTGLWVCL